MKKRPTIAPAVGAAADGGGSGGINKKKKPLQPQRPSSAADLVNRTFKRISSLGGGSDDQVARLLALDAARPKTNSIGVGGGSSSYLMAFGERTPSAKKPAINKHFLANTIRSVSHHNRREEEADCWRAYGQQRKVEEELRGQDRGRDRDSYTSSRRGHDYGRRSSSSSSPPPPPPPSSCSSTWERGYEQQGESPKEERNQQQPEKTGKKESEGTSRLKEAKDGRKQEKEDGDASGSPSPDKERQRRRSSSSSPNPDERKKKANSTKKHKKDKKKSKSKIKKESR